MSFKPAQDMFNLFRMTPEDDPRDGLHDISSRIEDGNGGGTQLPLEQVESESGRPFSG
jgi:hypothetical protein